MREYSGYDTRVNGTLEEYLRNTDGINTLYVSDYFFCLEDSQNLHFFYNPSFYWDSISLEEVPSYVISNLSNQCAILRNIDVDELNFGRPEGYKDVNSFYFSTPRIGNFYSQLGNKILTHRSHIYLKSSYSHIDNKDSKKHIKLFDRNDLKALLSYAVITATPNSIESIYDLKCFEKPIESTSNTIIGAVIGDVIGSVYEWNNIKTTDFNMFNPLCKFTDDTVLTIAIADSLLNHKSFSHTILEYGRKYPARGYGGNFRKWLISGDMQPYGSYGNGSAMRVSPVGFAYNNLEAVLQNAEKSAAITHDHPEGIKGAQATAAAIFLAREKKSKQEIKEFISSQFKYDLDFTLDEIRDSYKFDVTCQGSVPEAIVAFLESSDYEHAIRLAISIGGDSDTIACITGGIASAYYQHIPDDLRDFVVSILPREFIHIMNRFDREIYQPIN